MLRWLIVCACLCVPHFGCAPSIRATDSYSMHASWQNYERIIVHGANGAITLAPGSEAVEVSGEKHAHGRTLEEARANVERIELRVGPAGDDPRALLIALTYPDDLGEASPGASIHIRVPKPVVAELRTSNGGIQVDRMRDVTAESGNGAVKLSDIDGEARISTSNGRIDALNIRGATRFSTSNGAVHVVAAQGSVEGETSNGRIDIELAAPASVAATTSNGDVHVTIPAATAGDVDLSTSNGAISLVGNPALKLANQSRRSLSGTLNGGGAARIKVRTSNGHVTFATR